MYMCNVRYTFSGRVSHEKRVAFLVYMILWFLYACVVFTYLCVCCVCVCMPLCMDNLTLFLDALFEIKNEAATEPLLYVYVAWYVWKHVISKVYVHSILIYSQSCNTCSLGKWIGCLFHNRYTVCFGLGLWIFVFCFCFCCCEQKILLL